MALEQGTKMPHLGLDRGWAETAVTIPEALDELTERAFVLWLRLISCQPPQLSAGVGALCKALKLRPASTWEHLKELRRKGYIKLRKSRTMFQPTTIELRKRLVLPQGHFTVKLGQFLAQEPVNNQSHKNGQDVLEPLRSRVSANSLGSFKHREKAVKSVQGDWD